MSAKTLISEHLERYLREVHSLLAIIVSDYEGVHIHSTCKESAKQKMQKMIQTSTMLICTISQCEGNFHKIGSSKSVNPITYYFQDFVIHFRKSKSFVVTLFMDVHGSGLLAEELSAELVLNFAPLNSAITVERNQ